MIVIRTGKYLSRPDIRRGALCRLTSRTVFSLHQWVSPGLNSLSGSICIRSAFNWNQLAWQPPGFPPSIPGQPSSFCHVQRFPLDERACTLRGSYFPCSPRRAPRCTSARNYAFFVKIDAAGLQVLAKHPSLSCDPATKCLGPKGSRYLKNIPLI